MIDESGNKISDEDLMKMALEHLAEACCCLYEIESDTGIAAAFMADAALRYTQAVYHDKDPHHAEE